MFSVVLRRSLTLQTAGFGMPRNILNVRLRYISRDFETHCPPFDGDSEPPPSDLCWDVPRKRGFPCWFLTTAFISRWKNGLVIGRTQ